MSELVTSARELDRIDVHAHFVPDFYREALVKVGLSQPDGIKAIPPWSEEAALEIMNRLGVRTALLSISSPGVNFGDDVDARLLARRVNEEGARLVGARPDRFGYLAAVPLPDVRGAIDEAIHALDTLGADGLVLETNSNGVYLGDPLLEPFFSELHRRRAVVLVHPTSPACACSSRMAATIPNPVLEFMFETMRSITDLVTAGVLERYPGIRIIVPHAGAALAVLVERIDLALSVLAAARGQAPPSMRDALKTLHYDLAGIPVPFQLQTLLQVADPRHLHYGSDFPFTPAGLLDGLAASLERTPLLTDGVRAGMWRDNALSLFPCLARYYGELESSSPVTMTSHVGASSG